MGLQNIRIGKRLAGGFTIFIIIIVLLSSSLQEHEDTDARANEIPNINFLKAMMSNAILTNLNSLTRRQAKPFIRKINHVEDGCEKRKHYMRP